MARVRAKSTSNDSNALRVSLLLAASGCNTTHVRAATPPIAYVARPDSARSFRLVLDTRGPSERCFAVGVGRRMCVSDFDQTFTAGVSQLLSQFLLPVERDADFTAHVVWIDLNYRRPTSSGPLGAIVIPAQISVGWSFRLVDRCGRIVIALPEARETDGEQVPLAHVSADAIERARPLLDQAFRSGRLADVPSSCSSADTAPAS